MSTADDASRLLKTAVAQVEKTRRLLEAGHAVDLADMEAQVGELCAAVQSLPGPEAKGFRPALVSLLDEVGKLGDELTRHYEHLGEEIKKLRPRTEAAQAARAYMRPGAKPR